MPPTEEAKAVFSDLGYTISGSGTEFIAQRKWRRVRVTVLGSDSVADVGRARPDGGTDERPRFQCFVTWKGYTGELHERLAETGPADEWAIIGVDADGDHEVLHGAT